MHISRHPTQPRALRIAGSPRELAEFIESDPDATVEFGGLVLGAKVTTTSQHDGKSAFGFDLCDDGGTRSVGRVVLQDTERQLEDLPEWMVYYENEDEALENLAILGARAIAPKVISHEVDWSYAEETLEESLAELSSRFGVSVKVINPHGPGGGWPIIEVTGKYANVERWLKSDDPYGYGFDSGDMKEFFYNIHSS
jgi:hypothetical protein